MKKRLLGLSCLVFLSGMIYAQKALPYIPSDVSMVMMANPKRMDQKADLTRIRGMEVYELMLQEMTQGMPADRREDFMKLFTDPEVHGLDGMAHSYLFSRNDEEGSVYAYLFELTDAKLFQAFLERQVDGAAGGALENRSIYEYLPVNDQVTVAWNEEVALVAGASVQMDYDSYGSDWDYTPVPEEEMELLEEIPLLEEDITEEAPYREYEDEAPADTWEEMEAPLDDYWEQQLEAQRKLQAEKTAEWVSEIMGRTFEQSLSTNLWYGKGTPLENDMHVWLDYGALMENSALATSPYSYGLGSLGMMGGGLNGFLEMTNLLYADSYLSMGINFEEGAIRMGTDLFASPQMLDFWRRSLDAKPNKKVLKYVPGEGLLGLYSMHYNLEGFGEGLREVLYPYLEADPAYGEMATAALDALGILFDEEALYDLLGGDLTVAFTGVQAYEQKIVTYEYDQDFNPVEVEKTVTKKMPSVTLMLSYGNAADMDKLIRLGLAANVLEREGGHYRVSGMDMDGLFKLALQDGILFLTNDQELVGKQLQAGGYASGQQMSKANKKLFRKHAQTMIWDIRETAAVLAESEIGAVPEFSEFLTPETMKFRQMNVTTSRKVSEAVESEIELLMEDAESNALEQLFDMLNDLFLASMGGSKT